MKGPYPRQLAQPGLHPEVRGCRAPQDQGVQPSGAACPLPACWLLRRCPGSSAGRPHCPGSGCLSVARDKPVAEQLVGFPQPWTSWDYIFLSEQPLATATPHQHHNRHPCSFSFNARPLPRRDEKKNHKASTRFPRCPSEAFSPSSRGSAVCGGCVHKKPERPSGIAQPCRAQSILPLNMKLPLSPSTLPRGWVSPHFPSLTLAQRGGLRSSAFTSLSFFPVLFSPLSFFPSFSSGYFS